MLKSLIKNSAAKISSRLQAIGARPVTHALVEQLESRCLLSSSPATPPAEYDGAALQPLVNHPSREMGRAAKAATTPKVAATPISSSQVDLTWTNNPKKAKQSTIFARSGKRTPWQEIGTVLGQVDRYSVTRLLADTQYLFRVKVIDGADIPRHSNIVRAKTLSDPVEPPGKVTYSDPIVITRGGVYSGNWQSMDPDTAAVQIRTSEPVIIENSNIRSRGACIDAFGYEANITVRNTRGYGLNPNVRGRYPGRFLDIDGFTNLVAENNYMEGTSGIYLYSYQGNRTPSQTVKILRNQAKNIDGRYSNGKGGFLTGPDDNYYVQFFQINGVNGLVGAEVAWNQVINEPGKSRVEENINIFSSSGTSSSPFLIHDNYIQGAYAADFLHDTTYGGGGIMLSDVGSSWIRAYNNHIVNTGAVGIVISSGHDNTFYNNRILSSGRLPDGTPMPYSNVGAAIFNFNNERDFRNNSGSNNLIGWMQGDARNDAWVPDASSWNGNKGWNGTVTPTTEAAELALWQSKLGQAQIRVGASDA